jgi:hypothetical protein
MGDGVFRFEFDGFLELGGSLIVFAFLEVLVALLDVVVGRGGGCGRVWKSPAPL